MHALRRKRTLYPIRPPRGRDRGPHCGPRGTRGSVPDAQRDAVHPRHARERVEGIERITRQRRDVLQRPVEPPCTYSVSVMLVPHSSSDQRLSLAPMPTRALTTVYASWCFSTSRSEPVL